MSYFHRNQVLEDIDDLSRKELRQCGRATLLSLQILTQLSVLYELKHEVQILIVLKRLVHADETRVSYSLKYHSLNVDFVGSFFPQHMRFLNHLQGKSLARDLALGQQYLSVRAFTQSPDDIEILNSHSSSDML